MKVAFCGGRDYEPSGREMDRAAWWIDDVTRRNDLKLIHGDCRGVDTALAVFPSRRWPAVPVIPYPADWNAHGKAAGPIRNEQMAEDCDMLIAFPGGRGTEDMIRRVRSKGKVVILMPGGGDGN